MRVYSSFLLVLSQNVLQLMLKQKNKQKDKRNLFCANACKYLRNKLIEVAKVFELTKKIFNWGDVLRIRKYEKISNLPFLSR